MFADDMICLKDGEGGSNDLIEVDKNAPDHEKSERKSAMYILVFIHSAASI